MGGGQGRSPSKDRSPLLSSEIPLEPPSSYRPTKPKSLLENWRIRRRRRRKSRKDRKRGLGVRWFGLVPLDADRSSIRKGGKKDKEERGKEEEEARVSFFDSNSHLASIGQKKRC